jgi:diaminopimelate epimerase
VPWFWKGHALGNDYLVLDPAEVGLSLTPARVRLLCDRHEGVGADGVLVPTWIRGRGARARFGVRILNPDGSEAEKSGNGVRIFARWLHATRRTRRTRFPVYTRGGVVEVALVLDGRGEASRATLGMGQASFDPRALPCTLRGELLDRPLRAAGRRLRFTGVSVGNPHCVVFARGRARWTAADLAALGPALETHAIFPRRANVQLATVAGPRGLDVLVWERGAGPTRASGTSACAAAAAALRLGLVRPPVAVRMPGGTLRVGLARDGNLVLAGAVAEVMRGRLAPELLRALRAAR